MQEPLEQKKKHPIYAQLEPLTISIPCQNSWFGREDSEPSHYENTSMQDRSKQVHLKPFDRGLS